jgi:RNA polymerase sigma factor (sigma-70 family)
MPVSNQLGVMSLHLSRIAYDPDALEEFYRDHVEAVQRFCAHRVNDPYLLADLVADVFVAAIDSAATYDPRRGPPRAWLLGIARTSIAAAARESQRERRAINRVQGRALLDEDDVSRLAARIDAATEARALYAALATIPAAERALLELVAVDELTTSEAANALGIRPVTARVRLHRARRKLQRQLAQPDTTTLSQSLEATP